MNRPRDIDTNLSVREKDAMYYSALKRLKKGKPFRKKYKKMYGEIAERTSYDFLLVNQFIEEGPYGRCRLTDKGEKRLKDGFILVSAKEQRRPEIIAIATLIVSALTLLYAIVRDTFR